MRRGDTRFVAHSIALCVTPVGQFHDGRVTTARRPRRHANAGRVKKNAQGK